MRIFFFLALLLPSLGLSQDKEVEELALKSALTISAFKCQMVTEDPQENERLFNLGYEAGQEFLERIAKLDPDAAKQLQQKIAVRWGMVGGPSADFALGMFYQGVVRDVLDDIAELDQELSEMKSERSYREWNCAFLKE